MASRVASSYSPYFRSQQTSSKSKETSKKASAALTSLRSHGSQVVERRSMKSFHDVAQFWEELNDDIAWLRPHVEDLTEEQLKLRKNQMAKVDQNNPIWLEAPLRRLQMQMRHLSSLPSASLTAPKPDAKEVEEGVFRDIASVLQSWDEERVKDPEQFVITLQQILKHTSGVTPSTKFGGLSMLLHVLNTSHISHPEMLLSCWAFVLFEFKENASRLQPLLNVAEVLRSDECTAFLKTVLTFLQDNLPGRRVEGFNLYLLGEVKGPLMREMLAALQKYDPEGNHRSFLLQTLRPAVERACGLIETKADQEIYDMIWTQMRICDELLKSRGTHDVVKEKIQNFLTTARPEVDKLQEAGWWLGLTKRQGRHFDDGFASLVSLAGHPKQQAFHGIPPPPPPPPAPPAAVIPPAPGTWAVPPPPPPPPALGTLPQGPVPPPPPPQAFVTAPPLPPPVPAGVAAPPPPPPPPQAPPLSVGGLLYSLANGLNQPKMFPTAKFTPGKAFKAMSDFCHNMQAYLANPKRPQYRGDFQPWRMQNYVHQAATRGMWKQIKETHLAGLEAEIERALDHIEATAEMEEDELETKLQTLIYMIKDLDETPFGTSGSPESTVAHLRCLVDGIYVLYGHLHGVHALVGEGRNYKMRYLTKMFSDYGIDPRKRLASWETMMGFKRKFEERRKTTDEVHDTLSTLVCRPEIKQLLTATLMHSRQIHGVTEVDSDRLGACQKVCKHFALLRTMIDNLCKNYHGILMLEAASTTLPTLLEIQAKLKDSESCLLRELEDIDKELSSDDKKKLDQLITSRFPGTTTEDIIEEDEEEREREAEVEQRMFVVGGRKFPVTVPNLPPESLLHSLAVTPLPIAEDSEGSVILDAEDVTPETFALIAQFVNDKAVPSSLTTSEWNDLKVAMHYLGLEDLLEVLVEYDHVYFDKLHKFSVQARRDLQSISPVADEALHTLQVLTALLRRVSLIYDNIDTRSLTTPFRNF